MSTPSSKLGPIGKSLLTPCRRPGLSRKIKRTLHTTASPQYTPLDIIKVQKPDKTTEIAGASSSPITLKQQIVESPSVTPKLQSISRKRDKKATNNRHETSKNSTEDASSDLGGNNSNKSKILQKYDAEEEFRCKKPVTNKRAEVGESDDDEPFHGYNKKLKVDIQEKIVDNKNEVCTTDVRKLNEHKEISEKEARFRNVDNKLKKKESKTELTINVKRLSLEVLTENNKKINANNNNSEQMQNDLSQISNDETRIKNCIDTKTSKLSNTDNDDRNSNAKIKKTFKKLSLKKTISCNDELSDLENLTNSPNSQTSEQSEITQPVNNPQQDLEKQEIDVETILEMQHRIKLKKEELGELQRAAIYKKLHNVEELQKVIDLWKGGCKKGLMHLFQKLQSHGTISMDRLIEKFNVPEGIIDINLSQ